jgi:hypothetical protein
MFFMAFIAIELAEMRFVRIRVGICFARQCFMTAVAAEALLGRRRGRGHGCAVTGLARDPSPPMLLQTRVLCRFNRGRITLTRGGIARRAASRDILPCREIPRPVPGNRKQTPDKTRNQHDSSSRSHSSPPMGNRNCFSLYGTIFVRVKRKVTAHNIDEAPVTHHKKPPESEPSGGGSANAVSSGRN